MTGPVRLAIVSPDPTDNSQGVERFCHSLRSSVLDHGIQGEVIAASDFDETKYDLVLTNALISVKTKSIPRIHVYHGCHIPQIMRSHAESSIQWRAKFMIEAAFNEVRAGLGAHRVSVSNSCAREIRRWYGMHSDVITNGIDTDIFTAVEKSQARAAFGIDKSARIALFIGRPEWRKRPDIAIAAAQRTGYELYLAAAREFDGMKWLGKLSPDRLAAAISAADVVLMPTQYEACSLALLEALAVGTPVATTDAGWVPDLLAAVPDYRPLVAPIGKLEAFVAAIAGLDDAKEGPSKARDHVRENNSLDAFGSHWARYINDRVRPKA